jgi:hypothetical protein
LIDALGQAFLAASGPLPNPVGIVPPHVGHRRNRLVHRFRLLLVDALACLVICGMKGKVGMIFLALLFGPIPWFIGACRLAKLDSYWARKYYDDSKLRLVAAREGRQPLH